MTDPLTLPAADYDIEVFAAGADPASDTPALAETVTLPAGANASIVAHLDADGNLMLSVFVNDIDPIDAGNGPVTAVTLRPPRPSTSSPTTPRCSRACRIRRRASPTCRPTPTT